MSQNSRSRCWCFTLNNYEDNETAKLHSVLNGADIRYAIVGKETGDEGTPHLQGFVSMKNAKNLSSMKKINARAHWEQAKGNEEHNFKYCSKQGDYVEYGSRSQQGKRSDIEAVVEAVKNGDSMQTIAEEHSAQFIKYGRGIRDLKLQLEKPYNHDSTRGIWIWGPPGTGKSHTAREYDPEAFLKPQSKWWDGYQGEPTVILDDLDTDVLGHYLKIWADKYACTGETKGGTIHLRHKTFIVTSNYSPSELFKDDQMREAIERRFDVYHKKERAYTWDFDSGKPNNFVWRKKEEIEIE